MPFLGEPDKVNASNYRIKTYQKKIQRNSREIIHFFHFGDEEMKALRAEATYLTAQTNQR